MPSDWRTTPIAVDVPRWPVWLGGGVVFVAALALARVTAPPTDAAAIAQHEAIAARVAARAAFHRNLAQTAADSFRAAARRTDRAHATELARLRQQAASAFTVLPVRLDTAPRVIVGPATVSDTLVALPYARAALQAMADSAMAAMERLHTEALRERGRATLAMQRYAETVAMQDTVIVEKDAIITSLKSTRPGVLRRALGGIAHAGAGLACGAGGWAVGGPLWAIGAGAACAAVAGVVR